MLARIAVGRWDWMYGAGGGRVRSVNFIGGDDKWNAETETEELVQEHIPFHSNRKTSQRCAAVGKNVAVRNSW